jgi:hypothetical protein
VWSRHFWLRPSGPPDLRCSRRPGGTNQTLRVLAVRHDIRPHPPGPGSPTGVEHAKY